jgi:hypothetical protein
MTRDEFREVVQEFIRSAAHPISFREGDPTIKIGYMVQEWSARFRNLLKWHFMTLVSGNVILCNMPDQAPIHVYPGAEVPIIKEQLPTAQRQSMTNS